MNANTLEIKQVALLKKKSNETKKVMLEKSLAYFGWIRGGQWYEEYLKIRQRKRVVFVEWTRVSEKKRWEIKSTFSVLS